MNARSEKRFGLFSLNYLEVWSSTFIALNAVSSRATYHLIDSRRSTTCICFYGSSFGQLSHTIIGVAFRASADLYAVASTHSSKRHHEVSINRMHALNILMCGSQQLECTSQPILRRCYCMTIELMAHAKCLDSILDVSVPAHSDQKFDLICFHSLVSSC